MSKKKSDGFNSPFAALGPRLAAEKAKQEAAAKADAAKRAAAKAETERAEAAARRARVAAATAPFGSVPDDQLFDEAMSGVRRLDRSAARAPRNVSADSIRARAAATSPRTLLRWFAQVHGQTPQDYLHGLRIAQAQALLQTTYLTVEDVAQQCGYSDTGSFRKVFTRVCGVTPGAWRERFRLRTPRRQWLERDAP